MKRALMIASVASMIDQFNIPNIKILQELGYTVEVACNFESGSSCSEEKIQNLKNKLNDMGVLFHNIPFARNILDIRCNIKSLALLKKLSAQTQYSLIHCHSPIGGFIGRLAFKKQRKNGLHSLYTAHGFHFYKGAPLINWLLFYPIEKIASKWTDILITINQEDYAFAKRKMKAKRIEYIHGIGIDIGKYNSVSIDVKNKREALGLTENDYMILSVGELNKNKNHQLAIRALSKIPDTKIHYFIAGKGALKEQLEQLAISLGVDKRVHFLGFRDDILELNKIADLFIHPSYREGLPVSVMEAIASKTTVLGSKIRGNTDLLDELCLFSPDNVQNLMKLILMAKEHKFITEQKKSYLNLSTYDISNVSKEMKRIYTIV